MTTTGILVADGARARLFECAAADPALAEIECFANPEGRGGTRKLNTHRLPTVNESVGPARHSNEPHTTQREKFAARFAKALTDALERGRSAHRFERLIMVAPPRFLGALYHEFHKPLRDCVVAEIRRDLTELPAAQIRARLPLQAFKAA